MVATCGGESVCVIDCEVGMVMKKYKVPGEVCPIFFLLGCFFACLDVSCSSELWFIHPSIHPFLDLNRECI